MIYLYSGPSRILPLPCLLCPSFDKAEPEGNDSKRWNLVPVIEIPGPEKGEVVLV